MPKSNIIWMADIIGSREKDQKRLMSDFRRVTEAVSAKQKKRFLSPITITLGDEFQCVPASLPDAVKAIFGLEEEIIGQGRDFKLKHVIAQGRIDTPINLRNAHGMLGPGLTRARELLEGAKRSDRSRFLFELDNPRAATNLDQAFLIYASYLDDWRAGRDYSIASAFLETDDYKVAAERLRKNRSLIWKRERTLKIREYKAIKGLIESIAEDNA